MWICREGDEREGGEGGRTYGVKGRKVGLRREWEGGHKGRREGGGMEDLWSEGEEGRTEEGVGGRIQG